MFIWFETQKFKFTQTFNFGLLRKNTNSKLFSESTTFHNILIVDQQLSYNCTTRLTVSRFTTSITTSRPAHHRRAKLESRTQPLSQCDYKPLFSYVTVVGPPLSLVIPSSSSLNLKKNCRNICFKRLSKVLLIESLTEIVWKTIASNLL